MNEIKDFARAALTAVLAVPILAFACILLIVIGAAGE